MNDDLISRQAAIDYLLDALCDLDEADYVDKEFIEEELKRVPSVQPKQKAGRWIYTDTIGGMRFYGCLNCDNQEKDCIANEHEIQWYNYCPNCGAKMKRESEDYKNNE